MQRSLRHLAAGLSIHLKDSRDLADMAADAGNSVAASIADQPPATKRRAPVVTFFCSLSA